jgi:hypothetical protein
MAVAGQRLARRLQRRRVGTVDGADLPAIEHRDRAKQHPTRLVALLARCVGRLLVALLDRHRRENSGRFLAAVDGIAEVQPRTEPGDESRGPARLQGDQELVVEAVAGQAVGRADLDPSLPAVRRQERACGLLHAIALGPAASVALLVAEPPAGEATGHRRLPSSRGLPRWRADPPPPARPPGRAILRVASRPASGTLATQSRRRRRRPPRARPTRAPRADARALRSRPCRTRRGRASPPAQAGSASSGRAGPRACAAPWLRCPRVREPPAGRVAVLRRAKRTQMRGIDGRLAKHAATAGSPCPTLRASLRLPQARRPLLPNPQGP